MKRLLLALSVVALFASLALAGEIVSLQASPDSGYGNTNDTITVSSSAATTIAAVGHGYQSITLQGNHDVTVRVHYKLDGTTTNITTEGLWFNANTKETIETNGKVTLQLEAGVASITLRRLTSQK